MDALEPLLEATQAEAWVYCLVRGGNDWRLRLPPNDTAVFHSVRAGRCRLVVGGEAVELRAGELAVLPHGDEHYVAGGGEAARGIELLDAIEGRPDPAVSVLEVGGGTLSAELVCGGFRLAGSHLDLLAGLPPLVPLRSAVGGAGRRIEALLELAADELAEPRMGSRSILTSIGRIMLVETLRNVADQVPAEHAGVLTGIRDPAIAQVLSAIHHEPERRWTVAELADLVPMSTSSLAARFRQRVGTSVGDYRRQWRMIVAMDLLANTDQNLSEIATATGYGSAAAFSRAFKRHTGQPPMAYRRDRHVTALSNADDTIPPLIRAALADREARHEP